MIEITEKSGMVHYLSNKLIPLSVCIALLIAVLAPVTFWVLGHNDIRHTASLYAENLAEQLQQLALRSPSLWKYQTYKLMTIAQEFRPTIDVIEFSFLDEKGEVISSHKYRSDGEPPGKELSFAEDLRFTRGTAPIHFNGRQVGMVEVITDDGLLLKSTAIFFMFSSLLGTALALLVYRYPVRVVQKMEEAIKDAAHFSQIVMDSIDDAISIVSTGDYRIAGCNTGFLKTFGLTMEEVRGKECYRLTHHLAEPCSPPFDTCPMKETVATGKTSVAEHVHLRKNGAKFYAEVITSPVFDSDGKVASVVHVSRDITERKRIEEEIRNLNAELDSKVVEKTRQLLEARDELMRSEKLAILGQLSGSVGHELRNPLGVMNNAVYLLKILHGDDDETTKEYLDIIKHEIDNSQKIISDLLDFPRTRTPQRQLISAGELIALSMEKCAIPDNIESRIDIALDLPRVEIDPLQMVQVFQNLITNAVQAMPDGGRMEITAEADRAAGMLKLRVTDGGKGIAPEHMKKLFHPLFTTKPRGIGLGLVVCRNLAEANGGRIEVESEPGRGTRFSVLLPVKG